MYNILILGPQGSGKGTQAERLSAKLGIPTISVGRLFRTAMDQQTAFGRSITEFVDKGERVPSGMVNRLMATRLGENDVMNGVILDGYPRTSDQKDALDSIFEKMGRVLTHVISINISDEEAVVRLSGRWVCSNTSCERNYHEQFNPPKKDPLHCDRCGSILIQRDDDKSDAIRRRLEIYHKDTQPLIDHYRGREILHEVNGERSIDEVEVSIAALFDL